MARERTSYRTVKAVMRGLITTALLAVVLPASASAVERVRIEQPEPAKIEVTPAVAKRVVEPTVRMRTVLRCRDGVCVHVSEKTALPRAQRDRD